jgi:4-oxalocrotonate tautomerase
VPFVRIDLRRGKDAAYRRSLSNAVQQALVEVLGVPRDNRFHIIAEHEADGLLYDPLYGGMERTEEIVFVQITLRRGRPREARQALHRAIVEQMARAPGVRPQDVVIILVENDAVDWSFGNGDARMMGSVPPSGPIAA